jgi:ParB family chromosome partitioning protein
MRAVLAKSTRRSTKSSWIDSWTRSREPAMQVWPVAAKMPAIAVQIGVVEDDVGRLAAELQADLLEPRRRALVDPLAAHLAAGEGDLGDIGVGHQRRPQFRAEAGHHVDHAGREAGLLDQLGEGERGGGGELRGLEHHRVARRQRRRQLPAGEQQRRVPRRDRHHHAQGLVAGVVEGVRLVDRNDRALDLVG